LGLPLRLLVRRILSVSLLLLFSLPLISPLFAVDAAGTNLPACCRKDGKHHCMMVRSESQDGSGLHVSTVRERCPYGPAVPVASHVDFFSEASVVTAFAGSVSHPTGIVQTEARLRISFDRSRQKRGPPSFHA
jgi:hypothetical protein